LGKLLKIVKSSSCAGERAYIQLLNKNETCSAEAGISLRNGGFLNVRNIREKSCGLQSAGLTAMFMG
jgi:hypothetical protein